VVQRLTPAMGIQLVMLDDLKMSLRFLLNLAPGSGKILHVRPAFTGLSAYPIGTPVGSRATLRKV
jgi:hypothetical protein